MTERQWHLFGCFAVSIGIPLLVIFIHWLIVTMPDYALGFGSCLALWISVAMIKNGGTK